MRPADAGVAYRDFLRSCGLSNANTIVALPRRDILLRAIKIPAAAAASLDKAVEYQVDSLHPFEEGGVDYSYAVLHKDEAQVQVLVVMVEKGIAAAYYDWFGQSGIPLAGFTASAAVLYEMHSASAPVLAISRQGETSEVLAISRDSIVNREVQTANIEREVQLCRSELRLPDDVEIARIEQPDVAYAAAQTGIVRAKAAINLLPETKRAFRSPWAFAPTFALGAIVALLLFAMAARSTVQDRLYISHLNQEIEKLEPKVKLVEKLETKQGRELTRIMTLRAVRGRTASRLEVLAEITRLLPATAYLNDLDVNDDGITINGAADSASGLLAVFAASPYFKSPEFQAPITKANDKEQFRIRMQLGSAAFKEGRP